MIRRQRGFMLYMAIALVLAIAAAGVFYNLWRSKSAELESFRVAVKVAGDAQEQRTKAVIAEQKRSADEAEKRSKRTINDIRAKYDGLRGNSAGSGKLPPVPDTAPVANDKARDSRLLEILRIAEEQTGQLTELQTWITEQRPK